MRRRIAIQRVARETKPYQTTLENLIEIIRDDDKGRLTDVVQFLRSTDSLETAATALNHFLATQNDETGYGADQMDEDIVDGVEDEASRSQSPPKSESTHSNSFRLQLPSQNASGVLSSLQSPLKQSTREERKNWHSCLQLTDWQVDAIDEASGLFSEKEITQLRHDILTQAEPVSVQIGVEVRLPDSLQEHSDVTLRSGIGLNVNRIRIPIYLLQPLSAIESSPLCRVYTDFLRAGRHMIETGTPAVNLMGGDHIVVDLFFRPRRPDDPFTASSWASEVVNQMKEFDDFMRLAWIALLTPLMRWLLLPTQYTYGNVPDMMRPVCAQRLIPHVGSIDMCPLPVIREALVYRMRDWITALFRARCALTWDRPMDEVVQQDQGTGSLILTPQFRAHATTLANWSVSEHLVQDFPEIAGRINVSKNKASDERVSLTSFID